MKILLTGFSGYVGTIIKTHLEPKYDLFCTSSRCLPGHQQAPCDLTDRDAVFHLAKSIKPDVVIHAAGNKNIDFCETNHLDAFKVNCDSVKNLATAFVDARLIYLSTDYVFDGQRGRYEEHDQPNPGTVYGKSKLCGEAEGRRLSESNFVILRVSALYDKNANYVQFLKDKLFKNEQIECFADSYYSPTYYKDFLNILEKLFLQSSLKESVFHSCGQTTTRYDFAVAFARTHKLDISQIRKGSFKNRGLFLFPDLSLKNELTRNLLHVPVTSTVDALTEMSREYIK
jgi:dTDP-4-dehydrorhamnose reductase